jgi:FkbM family methyltransferase
MDPKPIDPIGEAIQRFLHAGQLGFDIGANTGLYTGLMAATGARVLAFEPNPDVQAVLAAQLPAGAELVRVAVSDQQGSAAFYLDGRPGLDGMASSILELDGMEGAPRIVVQTVTIDGFCARRRVQPDFIKIDAEGAEPMILAGGRTTIARGHRVIVFELREENWPRYREAVDWLAAADYVMTRLADGAPVPAVYLDSSCSGVADILAVPRERAGDSSVWTEERIWWT